MGDLHSQICAQKNTHIIVLKESSTALFRFKIPGEMRTSVTHPVVVGVMKGRRKTCKEIWRRTRRGYSLKWRRSLKFLNFKDCDTVCGVCECQPVCLTTIHSLTNHASAPLQEHFQKPSSVSRGGK